ncbi:uncharacterized protein LOC144356720 [Saccoglossus kowalevskii]
MTDVLGISPVVVYEQPLLITRLRPESAKSLPASATPRDILQYCSPSCEICCESAPSTSSMNTERSYPTLAVTRHHNHATKGAPQFEDVVTKLQLRREMEHFLQYKSQHRGKVHQRVHHRQAWKDAPKLQKPSWDHQRKSTNELKLDCGWKQGQFTGATKKHGTRNGFWKSMTSPTPGEQNLKQQQLKQSTYHKKTVDPDKINMSNVMKQLHIKGTLSAREHSRKDFHVTDPKRSSSTSAIDFKSYSGGQFRRSSNGDRILGCQRNKNGLIERGTDGRSTSKKPCQRLPLLASPVSDEKEVFGLDDRHVDLKHLCKSPRPITDVTSSRKSSTASDTLEIQSKAVSVLPHQHRGANVSLYEFHLQGDRDTVVTNRYTGSHFKYDNNNSSKNKSTKNVHAQAETQGEQSVSVQTLSPFDKSSEDSELLYSQTHKTPRLVLRQNSGISRQNSYLLDSEQNRLCNTPANTPTLDFNKYNLMLEPTEMDEPKCTCKHREDSKDFGTQSPEPRTKIEVFMPTAT